MQQFVRTRKKMLKKKKVLLHSTSNMQTRRKNISYLEKTRACSHVPLA